MPRELVVTVDCGERTCDGCDYLISDCHAQPKCELFDMQLSWVFFAKRQSPERCGQCLAAERSESWREMVSCSMNDVLDGLTEDECHGLVKGCDYAFDAAEQDLNPINWADAEAFFREGAVWFGKAVIKEIQRRLKGK